MEQARWRRQDIIEAYHIFGVDWAGSISDIVSHNDFYKQPRSKWLQGAIDQPNIGRRAKNLFWIGCAISRMTQKGGITPGGERWLLDLNYYKLTPNGRMIYRNLCRRFEHEVPEALVPTPDPKGRTAGQFIRDLIYDAPQNEVMLWDRLDPDSEGFTGNEEWVLAEEALLDWNESWKDLPALVTPLDDTGCEVLLIVNDRAMQVIMRGKEDE